MAQPASVLDLSHFQLSSGGGASLSTDVRVKGFSFGGQKYVVRDGSVHVRTDVSRTMGGYALRLRFTAAVEGPCMRCLEPAGVEVEVDAREVSEPRLADEELASPYVEGEELDLEAWARDALALALPVQIACRPDCAGLCAVCGRSLNEEPHSHEQPPDDRWSKLSELKLD